MWDFDSKANIRLAHHGSAQPMVFLRLTIGVSSRRVRDIKLRHVSSCQHIFLAEF